MNKRELKNALIELNIIGIISDKQLINLNTRLNQHFLNSPQREAGSVSLNEGIKGICDCANPEYSMPMEDKRCIHCMLPIIPK